MKYISTHKKSPAVDFRKAVLNGLAPDGGLYMPEEVHKLPRRFFDGLPEMQLSEVAFEVLSPYVGNTVAPAALRQICQEAFNFPVPLVKLTDRRCTLELFHGPTCAFKDFGGRFMARLVSHYLTQENKETLVLVATSGDTGSAVASGFHNVEGVKVVLLYPSGKVSHIQEQQLTTYGGNVTALELDGTFDDCQKLVKAAFADDELKGRFNLTSANSINLARLLPQSIYYYHAISQIGLVGVPTVFAVPSGNFGNLTGGLLAWQSGLPIKRFIAATNINDVVPQYLSSGNFVPRPSEKTLANAMDVGNPSNFARMSHLFNGEYEPFTKAVKGFSLNDEGLLENMREVYNTFQYFADPHGAIGYAALKEHCRPGEIGIFLETAHPAKFDEVVKQALNQSAPIPERLQAYLEKEKKSIHMPNSMESVKEYLLSNY